jgi:adenylate cyclase
MAADERATVAALDAARAAFREHIEANQGRVVDMAGDSVLSVFETAAGAVRAALAIQERLAETNAPVPEDRRMRFRIGVHLGDIIEKDDGTIYGDGVNVAARLEALAEPGGVAVSGSVHDTLRGRLGISYDFLCEQQVKNLPEPVRAYRVAGEATGTDRVGADAPPALPDKPSIAVLPFANLGGDPEQEYFADGIAEDLITALSRIRWLFVIARNSTFAYKGQSPDVRRVGRDLGVRYVLEGSVRKGRNRVRISAQLIDATTGNHVWAERYDRELEDLFDLQDEITGTIAGAIEPELGAFERARARRKPPESLDAWDCHQHGFWHLWQFDKKENAEAKLMFERAIELDPGFGPAYSGLAYSHLLDATLAFTETRAEDLEEAMRAAQKAIALDDRDALAHCTLGRVYLFSADAEAGISQLEIAIELNPSFALAHYGLGHAFYFTARPEESVASIDKAMRLSPHDPYLWLWEMQKALALSFSGANAEALAWARRATQHPTSGFWAFYSLVLVLGRMDRHEEARAALAKLLDLKPDFTVAWLKEYLNFSEQAVVEHSLEGLRKAGLEIPDEAG